MIENLDLISKINTARTLAPKWHTPIQHRRNLYHFKHYEGMGKIADGETRYADPTYTNTVDLAVGILHSNDFRWHVYGWTPSELDTRDTSSIEKYLAGTIHVNSLREEEDIRLETTAAFVRDGVAAIYSVWDPKEAAYYKDKIDEVDVDSEDGMVSTQYYKETPIIVKVIDPLSLWVIPGGQHRWSAIMKVEQLSVWDAEQKYPDQITRYAHLDDASKRETTDEFIDYWEIENDYTGSKRKTIVRNARLFGGDILKDLEDMPGYEHLPYTIGFFTNDMGDDPAHWVKGMIDVLENSVSMLEVGVNRRQRMIDVFTGLPILVKAKPGRTVNLDKSLNITKIEDGEEVSFPVWPGNPPDVDNQLEFFRSRIQQSGFSESMYGSASGLAGSGYAISQESDQNRIRLTQPIANLQLFWTLWAKKILSMTEKFAKKSKIRVYGRVRGKDFVTLVPGKDSSSFLVECRIRPDFPSEKTRKHAMATQARATLSEETLMTEYYDIEQPDDERKRKMIELAQNNPIAQQYAMFLNLKQLADDGDEAAQLSLDTAKSQLPKPAPVAEVGAPEQAQGLPATTGAAAGEAMANGQSAQEQMAALVNASPKMDGTI